MKRIGKIAALCCLLALLCAAALAEDAGVLVLPTGVQTIEEEAFAGLHGVERVDLPAGVTAIGAGAFRDCGDPSAELRYYFPPVGVRVGAGAFDNCRATVRLNGAELPRLTYTVAADGVTVTGMSGQPAEVVIPETIEGKPVVAIGNNVFNGKSAMTRVVIPATVTSIGSQAFRGCSALTGVDLPAALASLGSGAFQDCSALTEIDLPAGVTALPASVLQGARKLERVYLRGALTAIGESAFNDCYALADFEIPDTVTEIGAYAFRYCRSLTQATVPSGVTALPDDVFLYCSGLQSIQLPAGLQSIGREAFYGCTALTELELPAGLTSLGSSVFYNCQALTSISLPAGITALPGETFYNCYALTQVELPAGLTSIGSYVFNDCRALTSISLPAGITALPNNAFRNANALTEIELPEGLTTLGTGVFYDCRALTSISLPAGITALPNDTFYNCYALEAIELPEGLSSLGDHVFSYCQALTGIDLPAGVTALPTEAFRGCTVLAQIDLTGITSLGSGALCSCTALTEVTIPAGITALPNSLFEESTGLQRVHLPDTLTTINNYAFCHCTALTEISIPAGVSAIPYACFSGCSALRSVELPAGLASIGDHAFRECPRLTQINFPAGLTSIGQEAFRDACVGQPENAVYVLPGSVETFGSNAFYNCGAGLLVAEGGEQESFVQSTGYTFAYDADDGFRYQYKKVNDAYVLYLTGYKGAGGSIEIPAGPTVIGERAFYENTAITAVTIPAGVVTIDTGAFVRCVNLHKVVMPNTVTAVNRDAFYGCSALTDVTFSANLTSIGQDAFDYACTAAGTHFYNLPDHITTLDWTPFSECGAVPCFNRGSDTAALFRSNNNTSSIYYTYAGETDFRYRWYSSEGERLMQYTGSAATVEIPPHIWLIDDNAFRDNTTITKVVIPEGVTKIGNNAFRDCANLTDITLPDSLTFFMNNVFRGCGANAEEPFLLYLPDNISEVWSDVFTDCPAILLCGIDTTTADRISHRDWSFARNDRPDELDIRYKYGYVNNVWKPRLYDYVGPLSSIRLPDDCPNVDSAVLRAKINGGLELKCGQLSDTAEGISRAEMNFTFPGHEGIRYRIINDVLYLMGYVGTDSELVVPQATEWINAGRDEQVRQGCFTNLTALTRLVLPEGVTRLNDDAFSGCTNLTDITLPDSLKSMGQKVFRYAGQDLDEPFILTLPDHMEALVGRYGGANSFEDLNAVLECGKTSQTAATVTEANYCYTVAGEHDFRYRYLSYTEGEETGRRVWLVGYLGESPTVNIPAGIYGIRRFANSTNTNWPTYYGDAFFGNENVTKVVIPEGTVELEDSAFRGCVNLVDITFPSTLRKLMNHAVQDCGSASTTLHYYVLPDNIEVIGAYTANDWGTFNDLNLGRLACAAGSKTARVVSNAYTNHYNGAYFFALKGHETDGLIYRYERYDTDTEGVYDYRLSLWRYEGEDIEVTIPENCGVWRIEDGVFQDKNNLEKVVIPSGVAEIGSHAFDGCAMLHEGEEQNVIVIPSGVRKAGSLAFQGLGSAYVSQRFFLVLPASLTEFDISVFSGCNAVLVAPEGSAVAQALFDNWYYYYNTLADAIAGADCQYQHYYVDGVEQPHEHFGRR